MGITCSILLILMNSVTLDLAVWQYGFSNFDAAVEFDKADLLAWNYWQSATLFMHRTCWVNTSIPYWVWLVMLNSLVWSCCFIASNSWNLMSRLTRLFFCFQVVEVTLSCNIDFCKAFWNLSESDLLHVSGYVNFSLFTFIIRCD